MAPRRGPASRGARADLPGGEGQAGRAGGSSPCSRCRAGSAAAATRARSSSASVGGTRSPRRRATRRRTARREPAARTTSGWLSVADPRRAACGSRPSRRTGPTTRWPWSPRNQKSCQGWKIGPLVRGRVDGGRHAPPPPSRSIGAQDAAPATRPPRPARRRRAPGGQAARTGHDGQDGPRLVGHRQRRAGRPASSGRRAGRRPAPAPTHSAPPSSSSGWPISSARSASGLAATRHERHPGRERARRRAAAGGGDSRHAERDGGQQAGDGHRAEEREVAAAPQRRERARTGARRISEPP